MLVLSLIAVLAQMQTQPITTLHLVTIAPDGSIKTTDYHGTNFVRLSHGHFQFNDLSTGAFMDVTAQAGTKYSYWVSGSQQVADNKKFKK